MTRTDPPGFTLINHWIDSKKKEHQIWRVQDPSDAARFPVGGTVKSPGEFHGDWVVMGKFREADAKAGDPFIITLDRVSEPGVQILNE